MPTVSVLLPVHNGERWLDAALASVRRQTYADFELLVLDDGSSDGSRAIAERHAAADARVRVVSRANRGLVATLNELLAQARGELVARMDADDIALADRFARQVAFLREHTEVVCVGGDVRLIDEEDRFLRTQHMLEHDADIQREALRGHTTICHPCAMIRTDALRAVGGWRSDHYPTEDLDLWLRLGEVGRLANLRGAVLEYRLHAGSISAAGAEGRQRAAARRCCEDAWQRRSIADGRFDAGAPWRPGPDRASRQRFLLRYGWWAWHSGERRTSAVYALKALRLAPWSRRGWTLLACAAFKPGGGRREEAAWR